MTSEDTRNALAKGVRIRGELRAAVQDEMVIQQRGYKLKSVLDTREEAKRVRYVMQRDDKNKYVVIREKTKSDYRVFAVYQSVLGK